MSLLTDVYSVIHDSTDSVGQSATLIVTTDNNVFTDVTSPSKGKVSTNTSYTGYSVIYYDVDESLVDGTLIKKGDKSIIFDLCNSSTGYTSIKIPSQTDKIVINSVTYTLVRVSPVYVGSTIAAVFGVMRK